MSPSTDPEKILAARRRDYKRPGRKEAIVSLTRARRIRVRDELRALKSERGCDRCGFNSCPKALDFHHRDGTTKNFGIATRKALDASRERLEAEIAKCDILCANCHRMESCDCEQHD